MRSQWLVGMLVAALAPVAACAGPATQPATAPAHARAFRSVDEVFDTVAPRYVGRYLINLQAPDVRAANAVLQERVVGHHAFLEFRPLWQDQPVKGRFRIHAEDCWGRPVRINVYYSDGVYEGDPKDYVPNPHIAWRIDGWVVGTIERCEIITDQSGNGVLTIDLTAAEPKGFRRE